MLSRRLPFPLSLSAALVNESRLIYPEVPVVEFPDEDGEYLLIMRVTPSLWTRICSAVDIGRDIGYPDESQALWDDFITALEGIYMPNESNCEDVLSCLLADDVITSFGDAVLSKLTDNVSDPNAPLVESRGAQEMQGQSVSPTPSECDLDVIWSGIDYLVRRLDENVRDFLEAVEVESNKAKRGARLISLVPGFGSIAASAIAFFVDIAEELLDLYNNGSSEALLDAVACDLFQLVCSQCRYPTWEELYTYFSQFGIDDMPDLGQLSLTLAFDLILGTRNFAGVACFYTLNAIQCALALVNIKFNNLFGRNMLDTWVRVGAGDPSDGWVVLCGSCGDTWCKTVDLSTNDALVIVNNSHSWMGSSRPNASSGNAGLWVSGTGYSTRNITQVNGTQSKALYAFIDLGGDYDLTEVEIELDFTLGAGSWGDAQYLWGVNDNTFLSSPFVRYSSSQAVTGEGITISGSLAVTCDRVVIFLRPDAVTPLTGSCTLRRVTLRGTGNAPLLWSDCS